MTIDRQTWEVRIDINGETDSSTIYSAVAGALEMNDLDMRGIAVTRTYPDPDDEE